MKPKPPQRSAWMQAVNRMKPKPPQRSAWMQGLLDAEAGVHALSHEMGEDSYSDEYLSGAEDYLDYAETHLDRRKSDVRTNGR